MKRSLVFLVLLLLPGCAIFKKTSCTSSTSMAALIENEAINFYGCQNGALLISDWNNFLSGAGVCTEVPSSSNLTGAIAEDVCPLVIPLAVSAGFNLIIKPAYQCDPNKVGAYANSALTYLCEQIPLLKEKQNVASPSGFGPSIKRRH